MFSWVELKAATPTFTTTEMLSEDACTIQTHLLPSPMSAPTHLEVDAKSVLQAAAIQKKFKSPTLATHATQALILTAKL